MAIVDRRGRTRGFTLFLLFVFFASALPAQATPPQTDGKSGGFRPIVRHALKHDSLPSLKDAKGKELGKEKVHEAQPLRKLPKAKGKGRFGPQGNGAAATPAAGTAAPTTPSNLPVAAGMPTFGLNFEGVPNVDFVLPPDTEGDVGPNHYMQWVNLSWAIWDKDGTLLAGPTPGNALWENFGGVCENSNHGDPIVQYDHLADRWMASQFALFGPDGHHQCIAVSQTGDPTGAWFRYDFLISATKINDYPKFGVWPDAYYMSINQFDQNTFSFAGAGAVAFERDAMLQGQDAAMVYFDLFDANPLFGGQLPSDLDGLTQPPAGAPNIFMEADDDAFGFATDRLSQWEFHVDWNAPLSSTFGINGQPNTVLDTNPFEMELCGFDRSCIPQPGTDQGLDAISDRLMYRLQYRNFGDRQTLVANHTVDVDGNDHAGIRWYILENTGSGWAISDQGDHAPDAASRWMGSAALDASGNLALGYSVSSSEIFPSIRTGGRLVLDPAGTLPQPEGEMMTGSGSQLHPAARWGDYSMLAVDSTDDCTFWYTNEYLPETSDADWHTRIASFRFPSCTTGPRGTIDGTVTSSDGGAPIAGALVTAGPLSTVTNGSGVYAILVPADTYTVAASAYGFAEESVPGIVVDDGATVVQDFALDPLPEALVSGTVTDSAHGWPLYAKVTVGGAPIAPIYTDPISGEYQVTLFQQTEYTFKVQSLAGTYMPATRLVVATADPQTENFVLTADALACDAPGYVVNIEGLAEAFPTTTKPAGWSIIDELGGSGTWRFDDPAGRGNLTGGDGPFANIDSDFLGPDGHQDTILVSPKVDLSAVTAPAVSFRTDLFHFDFNDGDIGPEIADVDLSIDNGGSWTTVYHQDGSRRGPRFETVDIPTAAGEADVRVRFHYYNANFEWWWQVDDVVVGTRHCLPVEGGLVEGQVFDANSGDALNGATVAGPLHSTLTFGTPNDPAQGDGRYVLFEAAGAAGTADITASKTNYASDTESVTVVADAIVTQDFHLAAGILSASPSPLEATLGIGETMDRTLTLTNDGGAAATFEIKERDGGRDILAPDGAPLRVTTGHFSPRRLPDGKRITANPRKYIHPPAALPWFDIADYPTEIMDNTAAVLDGKVYSVGGLNFDGLTAGGFVYDPGSASWSPIAGMKFVREKPAVAFVGDLLYAVGGWGNDGIPEGTLEIYDPATDTWSTASPVPVAYAAAAAVSLDGQLYVIGGCGDFFCGATDVFRYDPGTDSWSSAASYPEPTSWVSCGPIDGRIYCAGGVTDAGELNTTYAYDPGSDSWSPLASMPQTAWAAGYIAAGEQLIISGGVTDNFSTVTNEGFAYDVAVDSWSPIPNSNNSLYRGASACGFYKIGGSLAGFSPVPASELLPDLEDCGGGADVPWLSEAPIEGSVDENGGTADVTVTFDASVPEVDQPGDYFAQLTIKENTPTSVPAVPVILHVTVPDGWGKLTGLISGTSRCDVPGSPLSGANVEIDGVAMDFSLKTASDGTYEIWMPATNGPVGVTVSKAGYIEKSSSSVVITVGGTTTEDLELRRAVPCATIAPESIEVTIAEGYATSATLDLGNLGPVAYDFVVAESPFVLGSGTGASPTLARTFKAPAPIGPTSVRFAKPGGIGPAVPTPKLPPWLGGAPVPGGIVRYAHAQCDGELDRFYVISGVNGFFGLSTAVQRFDAATNSWTSLAPIPEGGEGMTGICYAGRIHVFGGDGTDRHFIYDITTDSWSTGAPLPRTLVMGAAAAWAGKIYVAGGDNDFFSGGVSDEVDVYDVASDTWTGTASPMPFATGFAGFAQAGPYLYVVGGWNNDSPDTNVAAAQRYDLRTDTWSTGPSLAFPRSDLALAVTDAALYAIGGDADLEGPDFFFDASTTVERLTTADWDGGTWSVFDPLPVALTANNAGFCTTAFLGGEVWSVGGIDTSTFTITGFNLFTETPGESCPSIRGDVPWLTVDPSSGNVDGDSSMQLTVGIDGGSLAPGSYEATLLVSTTDPAVPEFAVAVHVTVQPAFIIAVENNGTVGGVAAANEDLLSIAGGSAAVLFDGSDVGLASFAIDAVAKLPDGSLLLSFTAPGTIPGVTGTTDDSDIVRFVPTSLGATTAGTFELWFDGSDVGLTTNNEDVDAIDVDGTFLYISTIGAGSVPGLVGSHADADILRIDLTSTGATTLGTWSLYADMSDVGLSTSSENVDALAIDGTNVSVSTTGALSVPGLTADDDDAAVLTITVTGTSTAGTWSATLQLDGATLGISANDVSAIELP